LIDRDILSIGVSIGIKGLMTGDAVVGNTLESVDDGLAKGLSASSIA